MKHYSGAIGPANFGTPGFATATSFSGHLVGFRGTGGRIAVPNGYVSGSALNGSSTFPGTFASLGATPGSYTWTIGGNPASSLTLNISAVPEPSSFLFLTLAACVGAAVYRFKTFSRS